VGDPVEVFLRAIGEGEVIGGNTVLRRVPGARINRTKLFEFFKDWAERAGYRNVPMVSAEFYAALRVRGIPEVKVQGNRVFDGFGMAEYGASTH
jgi:phage/plasmid-associated DNA primase